MAIEFPVTISTATAARALAVARDHGRTFDLDFVGAEHEVFGGLRAVPADMEVVGTTVDGARATNTGDDALIEEWLYPASNRRPFMSVGPTEITIDHEILN